MLREWFLEQCSLRKEAVSAAGYNLIHTPVSLRRGVKKKWIFYGQADRKGAGGGSATLALTVGKCENFDLFFH